MFTVLGLDFEGVEHEPNMAIAWMVGISRPQLLCDLFTSFQKVFSKRVNIYFDGNVFSGVRSWGSVKKVRNVLLISRY